MSAASGEPSTRVRLRRSATSANSTRCKASRVSSRLVWRTAPRTAAARGPARWLARLYQTASAPGSRLYPPSPPGRGIEPRAAPELNLCPRRASVRIAQRAGWQARHLGEALSGAMLPRIGFIGCGAFSTSCLQPPGFWRSGGAVWFGRRSAVACCDMNEQLAERNARVRLQARLYRPSQDARAG